MGIARRSSGVEREKRGVARQDEGTIAGRVSGSRGGYEQENPPVSPNNSNIGSKGCNFCQPSAAQIRKK
jgi:hypothetical protein